MENAYSHEVIDPSDPSTLHRRAKTKEILALVRAGNPVACRAYRKTVAYLCFGVVGMINALNPDTVVFADKIVNGGDLFLEVADQTFKQYLMPEYYNRLRIKVCTLDGDPMLLGASVLAFEQMLQTPSAYFQTAASIRN